VGEVETWIAFLFPLPVSDFCSSLYQALMLENLQKHSTPHAAFQPNSQVREKVCLDRMGYLETIVSKWEDMVLFSLSSEAVFS